MTRSATGWEALARAREAIKTAETAEDLRKAQAVLLPLECGLSLSQAAQVVGRTAAWVARQRRLFIAEGAGVKSAKAARPRGGRRNQLLSEAEEDSFMQQVCDDHVELHKRWRAQIDDRSLPKTVHYTQVGRPMRFYVQEALETKLGRPIPMSSVYNLMRRVGLRRFESAKPYHWSIYCRDLIWNSEPKV